MRAVPDFVIAGAPKCGTTALYEYLRSHPGIFLSEPKEPHFFADDLLTHRSITTLEGYRRLFARAKPDQRTGEASAWYLHSSVAIAQLLRQRPDVKLIVMLRQPIELLASLHSDLCWVCFEDESDFEKAWELQEYRQTGQRIPKLCQVPWFLQYRCVARLGEHVERLLRQVSREQVKFVVFDDFRVSPRQVYEEVLGFLDLAPDGRTEFPRLNASKRSRSARLARLRTAIVQSVPRPLVSAGKKFGLGHLSHQLQRWNTMSHKVRPISPELAGSILRELSDDIDRLSGCIGRDLSRWKQLPGVR
jgi:hypothetical protein